LKLITDTNAATNDRLSRIEKEFSTHQNMIELELKLNDSINAINKKRETSEKEFESKLSKL